MNQIFLETRMFRLSDGEEIMTLAFFILIQYRSVTDGQTDRQTDGQSSSGYTSACIARYANALVKTNKVNSKAVLTSTIPFISLYKYVTGCLRSSPYYSSLKACMQGPQNSVGKLWKFYAILLLIIPSSFADFAFRADRSPDLMNSAARYFQQPNTSSKCMTSH